MMRFRHPILAFVSPLTAISSLACGEGVKTRSESSSSSAGRSVDTSIQAATGPRSTASKTVEAGVMRAGAARVTSQRATNEPSSRVVTSAATQCEVSDQNDDERIRVLGGCNTVDSGIWFAKTVEKLPVEHTMQLIGTAPRQMRTSQAADNSCIPRHPVTPRQLASSTSTILITLHPIHRGMHRTGLPPALELFRGDHRSQRELSSPSIDVMCYRVLRSASVLKCDVDCDRYRARCKGALAELWNGALPGK